MPPETDVTSTSTPQTLDQKRALAAYTLVAKRAKDDGAYLSRARDLPVMIRTNGIGQTLAFLMDNQGTGAEAKAKKAILADLESWVRKRPFYAAASPEDGVPVLPFLLAVERKTWWRATNEAILFATWLKRWAEALISDKKDNETRPSQGQRTQASMVDVKGSGAADGKEA